MSKINEKELTSKIVELVGGINNVKIVTHCVTRLRLYLADEKKANDDEIKKLNGVLGVVRAMGQYQIILGDNIIPVYETLTKEYKVETEEPINENLDEELTLNKKDFKYYFEKIITFMAQSLTPFITAVYGAGMLKVILSLLSYFVPAVTSSSTYTLFNIMCNAPFYFMPIFVAYGASKVLKSNPIFSISIAATLLYPDFVTLMSGEEAVSMLGLGVHLSTYGSTLLPGLFVAIMCAYLEKLFYKYIPGIIRSVFAPLCIFLVGFPITVLILGPAGNIFGSWIVSGIVWLQSHVGGFAPGVIAAIHPFLVMFGVNMLMVAPMMELFTRTGYDNVFRPGWILHNISEGGACLAVALKTKNKDLKTAALSACIGAFVSGVSEPALYGINLRLKKPMIGLVVGAFAGGSVAGFLGAKAFSMGYSSILGVVIFEETIVAILAGVAVSFAVSFLVTFLLYDGKDAG